MCGPAATSYPLVADLVQLLLPGLHAASRQTLTALVWALLRAQSLHPADLARALPDLQTSRARQAMRRVRRTLGRDWLGSPALTPRLLAAALWLTRAQREPLILVLDSTRLGRWELLTLGVGYHGRVLVVAWAILPYPWPKGAFTPTVLALLERVLAQWPPERGVHLTADRGFPSLGLFQLLARHQQRLDLGYTIRLRAGDWVWQAGQTQAVGSFYDDLSPDQWRVLPAHYCRRTQAGPPAWLVIGQGTPVVPAHQRGPADTARRARRLAQRQAYLRGKGQPNAPDTDRVWALLTNEPEAATAVARYCERFATEPTYRDLKSWDLETVAQREASETHLDGLVGLSALSALLQTVIGVAAGRTTDPVARARQAQWSTTDRLSSFWRGRQVLHDHAHDWRSWLDETLGELVRSLTPEPPVPLPEQHHVPRQEAA
jgi:hypothetical protein